MDLKSLKDKRNKLLADMQAISIAGFTAENRANFDRMNAEVTTLEADIQRAETIERYESEQRSFQRSPRPGVGSHANPLANLSADEKRSKVNSAFRSFALNGLHGMPQEQRDLLTTADGTGGALIPQEFMGVLLESLKFYGATATLVRQRKSTNGGAPLKISLANDTANGLTLLPTEGGSSPTETDPAFSSKILGVDTVTGGLVKVSFQELEDSNFDLDSWLRDAFGKRYGRGLETAVTTGRDSAGTALPNVQGLASVATVGTTTASLAAGIGWTDLTIAFGALDAAYINPKTTWLMNTTTRAALLGMKDGFGRPFWTPDPSADGPFSKLLGYDVVLNQALPNIGTANGAPILLGSLTDAYLLRSEGQPFVLRLNERFADELSVGFYLYSRIGGTSIVATGAPSPLVSIKQAAA